MKVALILSGCGHLDGSEIRESVLAMLFLDKYAISYECFAPNKEQRDVINYVTNETASNSRNVLEESARIARGKISEISNLDAGDFDALIIPGGFGTAKNLSDIAVNGPNGVVDGVIQEIIESFWSKKKPIGAICFAPAIVACALGKSSNDLTLTLGKEEDGELIEKFGCKHQSSLVQDAVSDEKNKICSTPAYMYCNATVYEVSQGIEKLVKKLLEWKIEAES